MFKKTIISMAEREYQSKKINGKYQNKIPWPHGHFTGIPKFMRWICNMMINAWSVDENELQRSLPVLDPYFNRKDEERKLDAGAMRATWLGHASVLVEIEGLTILCDPVFSDRCGPKIGFKRYRRSPCSVAQLPEIDAVVISHNHYDHMDSGSIYDLSGRFRDITWLIPAGSLSNLTSMMHGESKRNKIHEKQWWEEHQLSENLKIVFTPTQHWSNRGLFDAFKSLWGSWAFIGKNKKFWFGGDTGYCDAFKEIGEVLGPFDAAAIPIGAYEPRDLLKFQHVNPEEAVRIHEDIKSAISFAIHWGTFNLTEEKYDQPKAELENLVSNYKANSKKLKFITLYHGQTLEITKEKDEKIYPDNRKEDFGKIDQNNPGEKSQNLLASETIKRDLEA